MKDAHGLTTRVRCSRHHECPMFLRLSCHNAPFSSISFAEVDGKTHEEKLHIYIERCQDMVVDLSVTLSVSAELFLSTKAGERSPGLLRRHETRPQN